MQEAREGVAIYHVVLAHEDFEQTAFILLRLLQKAQRMYPGQERSLYLDIEGHRNASGGFDRDMLELQSKFATEFLMPFLSRVIMPLATLENPQPQKDEIPDKLTVLSIDSSPGEGPSD